MIPRSTSSGHLPPRAARPQLPQTYVGEVLPTSPHGRATSPPQSASPNAPSVPVAMMASALLAASGASPPMHGASPPGSMRPTRQNSPLPSPAVGGGTPPLAGSHARFPALDVGEVKRNFVISLKDSCPQDVQEAHECPVCNDVAMLVPLSVLPCKHRLCCVCVTRLESQTCPFCRTAFDLIDVKRGELGGVAPFVTAACRHCKKAVPLDQVHAFKHFCPQRQQAYQRTRALAASTSGSSTLARPRPSSVLVTPAFSALGYGESPIFAAKSVERLEELAELGHDLHATDEHGRTALHIAFHLHRQDLIDYLLRQGLSPFQPCNQGITAIDYALYAVRSESGLEFVEETLRRHPDMRFHRLSFVLHAQRGNTIALDYLCKRLRASSEPKGPLLQEMFNAGISGNSPLSTINVLRQHFAGIEEIVLRAAITHGAISVFNDCVERKLTAMRQGSLPASSGGDYWREAVDLCFSCRKCTPMTHRIFVAVDLFFDKKVQAFLEDKFWAVKPATSNSGVSNTGELRDDAVIGWFQVTDVESFKVVVEQRKILNFPAADSRGVTLLHLACQSRNHSLVEHLLAAHGDYQLTESCSHNLYTPLHYACLGPRDALELSPEDGSDAYFTIRLLLDRMPRNARYSAVFRRTALCESCLDVADPLAEDVLTSLIPGLTNGSLGPDGKNTLHHAAASADPAFALRYLLGDTASSTRFDVNKPCSDGFHALHYAAYNGNVDAVRYLLAAPFNAQLVDANGQTALHHAASAGAADVCRLLLRRGSRWAARMSVHDRDAEGRTPLSLAPTDELRELLECFERDKRPAPSSAGLTDLSSLGSGDDFGMSVSADSPR
jgi:ankyrin repeat protein